MIARVVHPAEVQARACDGVFDHYGGRQLDVVTTDCVVRSGIRLGKGRYDFHLPEQRASMSQGDIALGGSWAPQGYIDSVFVARENVNAWKRVADVFTIPADAIDASNPGTSHWTLPTVETTGAEGDTYPENTDMENSSQHTVGARVLTPRIHASGFDFASNKLVRDSAQALQRGLGGHQGKKAARAECRYMTSIAVADIKVNKTAASAVAITIDEILDLVSSVSAEVRAMPGVPKFMVHPNTLLALLKLKDGDVRAWRNAGLDKYEVVENSMMPTIATGNKAVFFGDLKAVKVVETLGLTLVVVSETRAEIYQTGFNTIVYSDIAVADLNGIELAALQLA